LAEAYKIAALDAWNRLRPAAGEVIALNQRRKRG
jgi:hypothetical protein